MATKDFIVNTQYCKLVGTNVVKAQNEVDFSTINAISGDVCQVLKIPAGAFVTNVGVLVETAQGSTATATVGDASGENTWIASVNLNSAAFTPSAVSDTNPALGGKYYSSNSYITMYPKHTVNAAKAQIIAHYSIVE